MGPSWRGARRGRGVGDWDAIDILLRRSTDDGRTWSEPRRIAEVPGPVTKNPASLAVKGVRAEDVTYNNPVLIADRNGQTHCLFCVEYMHCFAMHSDDEGLTWSTPVEITSVFRAFRPAYDWKVLATGPDHGIQTRSGRLVVPVWISSGTGGNAHRPSVTATIFSDDHGKTWQAGEIAVPCDSKLINPNETVAVELADGRVLLNTRSESKANRRLVTISPDGASHWSAPRFDNALLEPICMAGLIRYSSAATGGKNRILFSNPDNLARADGKDIPGTNRDRKNMTVQLSYDECQTWPVKKVVEPVRALQRPGRDSSRHDLVFLWSRPEGQLRGRSANRGPLQSRVAHRRQGRNAGESRQVMNRLAAFRFPPQSRTRNRAGPGRRRDPDGSRRRRSSGCLRAEGRASRSRPSRRSRRPGRSRTARRSCHSRRSASDGQVDLGPVDREAAGGDQEDIRVGRRDLVPGEPPRPLAGPADHLATPRPGDDLGVPVPRGERRVEPFEEHDPRDRPTADAVGDELRGRRRSGR